MRARAALAAALSALASAATLAACGGAPAPTVYVLNLRVTSDGHAMPGAKVLLGQRELGATDAQGMFTLRTTGQEGASMDFTVQCPRGFTSPTEPVRVPLRSSVTLDGGTRSAGIETSVPCPPAQRVAAVVVRTPGRANLPILYQGREITRTDLQGVAHMIFRVNVNDILQLQVNTSEQPLLRPVSPLVRITTQNRDDVYVATVNLDQMAAPRPVVHRPPAIQRPIRIPPRRSPGGFF